MAVAGAPLPKVYYAKPMLPDVSRVLACLYEKDIEFDLIDVHEDLHMHPVFLQLQLSQRSPILPPTVFEDGSNKLFDSRAICRYIAEKHVDRRNKNLLGRDLLERASVEQWLKSEEHSFHPPSWELVFHLTFAPLFNIKHVDRARLTKSEQSLAQVLDVYENRLSESRFLAGNQFTLADLSHLPNSHHLANSEEYSYLFDSRKNVKRWFKKISNRPSWTKAIDLLNKIPIHKEATVEEDGKRTDRMPQLSPSISSSPSSSKVCLVPPLGGQASVEKIIQSAPADETELDGAKTESTHQAPDSKSSKGSAASAAADSMPQPPDQQAQIGQSKQQAKDETTEPDYSNQKVLMAKSEVSSQPPSPDSTHPSTSFKAPAQPYPTSTSTLTDTDTQYATDKLETPYKPTAAQSKTSAGSVSSGEHAGQDKIPYSTLQEKQKGFITEPTKTTDKSDSSSQSTSSQIGSSTRSQAQQKTQPMASSLSKTPSTDSLSPPATTPKPTPRPYPSPEAMTQLTRPKPTAESATQTPDSKSPSTSKPTSEKSGSQQTVTQLAQTVPRTPSTPESPPTQLKTQVDSKVQVTSQADQTDYTAGSTTREPDASVKPNARQSLGNLAKADNAKASFETASSTTDSSLGSGTLGSSALGRDNETSGKQAMIDASSEPGQGDKPVISSSQSAMYGTQDKSQSGKTGKQKISAKSKNESKPAKPEPQKGNSLSDQSASGSAPKTLKQDAAIPRGRETQPKGPGDSAASTDTQSGPGISDPRSDRRSDRNEQFYT